MIKNCTIFLFLVAQLIMNIGQATILQCLEFSSLPGFYVGGVGGFNGGHDIKCECVATKLGYYLGAKAGKKFSFFRLEGEFVWQRNEVYFPSNPTIQLDNVRGHINIWSLMTNALIDFNCEFPVRPFIGGGLGIGYAYGHWSGILVEASGNYISFEKRIQSTYNKRGFAWQVITGLKYLIFQCLEVTVEYRFFEIESRLKNHKVGFTLIRIF